MMLKDAKPGDVVTSSEWGGDVYVVIDASSWGALHHPNRVYLLSLNGDFRLMNGGTTTEVTIVNPEGMK